uniref:Uncharacterized protein n=1 Tax=Chlamydomonas chlamydogama TaxID=225041 RepID=A0A6T5TRN4_9CHLO|mmetsp:Transcript_1336/g.2901  ORF Transcript_1336/g.2901 Transcript_1336/m.2901 type:complete len:122 (+) Transcript_1336:615-980(+)
MSHWSMDQVQREHAAAQIRIQAARQQRDISWQAWADAPADQKEVFRRAFEVAHEEWEDAKRREEYCFNILTRQAGGNPPTPAAGAQAGGGEVIVQRGTWSSWSDVFVRTYNYISPLKAKAE